MSNRLEGLKPGKSLKFKPKVVARKSKEDRERDAPKVKQEPTETVKRGTTATRGRGGRRNQYAGTHMVSSGPLSSGSVAMGNASGSKLGLTQDQVFNSVSPTPDFLQNLKMKEKREKLESEDSDDDDPTKINMTREYAFADEETVLFPVRPVRDEVNQVKAPVKQEPTESVDVPTGTVSVTESREASAMPAITSEEPIEEAIDKIKAHKEKLENKISNYTDTFEQHEHDQLISDHARLLGTLTDKLADVALDDKFMMFQLPRRLPSYTKGSEEPIADSELSGQIGRINIHQSGKISINLGADNDLDVHRGTISGFLQELVMMEMHAEDGMDMIDSEGRSVGGDYVRLGVVEEKVVGRPQL